MRILGSSMPAEERSSNTPDIGRDVTAEKFLSAVFLLADCGTIGVIILGYPARSAATPPLSVPSPNVSGSRDAGLGDRGARCKDDQRESKLRRPSSSSPPVGETPGSVGSASPPSERAPVAKGARFEFRGCAVSRLAGEGDRAALRFAHVIRAG